MYTLVDVAFTKLLLPTFWFFNIDCEIVNRRPRLVPSMVHQWKQALNKGSDTILWDSFRPEIMGKDGLAIFLVCLFLV